MKLTRFTEQFIWTEVFISSAVHGAYLRENLGELNEQQGAAILEGTTLDTFIEGPATAINLPVAVFTWIKNGFTTTWSPSSMLISQEVTIDGETTTIVLSGTTVDVTLSEDTTIDLSIPGIATTVTVGEIPQDIVHGGTGTKVTVTGATTVHFAVSDVSTGVSYAGTTVTLTMPSLPGVNGFKEKRIIPRTADVADAIEHLPGGGLVAIQGKQAIANVQDIYSRWAQFTTSVTVDGTTVVVSLDSPGTTVSLEGTEIALTLEGITLDQISDLESEAVLPTHYPMTCEAVPSPITEEEEVQLRVLFSTGYGESTFAEHVAEYADGLVSQMWMISNDALNLGGLTFTSLFTEVDITGILGLASAAPVYTCFLSSMWANDMNSVLGQPFKRDIPSEEEAKKLVSLFSRHEDGGNGYDLVELLIDETEELINEVRRVAGAGEGVFNATASGSVFSRLNVQHLLAVARDAPVYSNGLSAAIETALSEYRETLSLDMTVSSINDLGGQEQIQSQSQSAISSSATSSISEALTLVEPVTTISTTNTYITVFTISTNYRDGTATVPTSMVTTSTFTIIKPIRTVHSTRSILIESADRRMASMATSDSNQIVEEISTETVRLAAGGTVTDSEVTVTDGPVTKQTGQQIIVGDTIEAKATGITTIYLDDKASVLTTFSAITLRTTVLNITPTTLDPTSTVVRMAYFTQVQAESTRIFSIAVQTVNDAAKLSACACFSIFMLLVYFL